MELTGKCKEEFENYAISNNKLEFSLGRLCLRVGIFLVSFYDIPDSMKWGVYQDYFDSVDLIIEIPFYWGCNFWKVEISQKELPENENLYITRLIYSKEDFKTRPEARTAAIEKANEIRNKQLKDESKN